MENNFWQKIKRPFFALAPMADVTDVAFRSVIAKYGKPDVFWTEFVSADGLILADKKGKEKLLKNLMFSEVECPIIAQIFSSKPEMIKQASKLCLELGFDGVDINMGCPDRSIEKQGAGAVLCKNPELAKQLILGAKEGVENKIPISVKIRLGYNQDELETWLPELLSVEPALITVHARTRKEMSKVPARWERVKRAVEIRDRLKSKTLIAGNGDVLDLDDAKRKAKETGADGVMLGRAIFGKPYLFSNSHELENKEDPEVRKKILNILIEHTKLFEELLGDTRSFAIMKKHFKAYSNGFPESKDLKMKLMGAENAREVEQIIIEYKKPFK